jgi:hypothetical protein
MEDSVERRPVDVPETRIHFHGGMKCFKSGGG